MRKIKFLILIIGIILLFFIGSYFRIETTDILRPLARIPLFFSCFLFVFLYVIFTFFIWLSKDVFRFVAALLFGAYLSTLLVFISEIINAVILFSLSRVLGRSFVEGSLKGKYQQLDEKIGRVNFFWLFMFRAVPLIPFRFLDLAAGLTKINFKRYFAVVILGSPLRIFWLQYILAGVGRSLFSSPTALMDYLMAQKGAFIFSLIYLIMVIVVAFKLKKKGKNGAKA